LYSSNILIGLLNFLKRSPPPPEVVTEYLAQQQQQNAVSSSPSDDQAVTTNGTTKAIPIPQNTRSTKKSFGEPILESPLEERLAVPGEVYPIQLPSFATVRGAKAMRVLAQSAGQGFVTKSLPTESVLDAQMKKRKKDRSVGGVSDGTDEKEEESKVELKEKKRKFPKHLWHAAFALVLERGRAVSRRVVVTSSPLYQPMEKIQNLGYEVRVYIRVPDLGECSRSGSDWDKFLF